MRELWKWDERTTRNCIHAKVLLVGDTLTVQCAKRHRLREAYTVPFGYGLSYEHIITQPGKGTAKVCLECPDFEHDEKQEVL